MAALSAKDTTVIDAQLVETTTELTALVAEIGNLSDRLRHLRAHESDLRGKLLTLEQTKRIILNVDIEGKVKSLSSGIADKDQQMRELQLAYERLEAQKLEELEELSKVQKLATAGVAGKRQESTNALSARFDLAVPAARSGSSQDTLAQTPAIGQNSFAGKPVFGAAGSINDIGAHTTASPFVNPKDYIVVGDRPSTANSAKFDGWRSPHRLHTSTRIAQPPGGRSSNIFG